ncbi:group II intron maturase-specific domain-containing protein [Kitasatospora aureofaciens]|uniref:group II intron maturase-specific domain-containing protein n=1 Tax=Kitasatospora aureofaciens TaxID=1894 RepID=UPI0033F5E3F3
MADLNPVLRGWAAYFRNGNSGRKFNAVDGYVHERLAIFASRKHGLAGRNWTTRYTYGWITRARGLPPDRERTRGDGACQPVNDVGKPCAGELHARFEAAGTGNAASATAPVPDPTSLLKRLVRGRQAVLSIRGA